MAETIKQVLMRRDKMSSEDADDLIQNAREAFQDYLSEGDIESAEDVCVGFFGLESDYLEELI